MLYNILVLFELMKIFVNFIDYLLKLKTMEKIPLFHFLAEVLRVVRIQSEFYSQLKKLNAMEKNKIIITGDEMFGRITTETEKYLPEIQAHESKFKIQNSQIKLKIMEKEYRVIMKDGSPWTNVCAIETWAVNPEWFYFKRTDGTSLIIKQEDVLTIVQVK